MYWMMKLVVVMSIVFFLAILWSIIGQRIKGSSLVSFLFVFMNNQQTNNVGCCILFLKFVLIRFFLLFLLPITSSSKG